VEATPGGTRVLRGVDLTVEGGRRVALVGPSGAGKTTLLRVIAGLEPPRAGAITLDGRDLSGVPAHRRGVAVVFQEPRLFPNLDVTENVAFPLRAEGAGRRERRERARRLLDEVGLAALEGRGTAGLSGGEQQRVSLARALCGEPRLLLLDEPLASVDPNRRDALRDLILRVQAERGVSMLVVTHDQAEAAELGERIALMIEGRVVQEDTPESLFLRPVSPVVARFFGSRNLISGQVVHGVLATPAGPLPVPGPDGPATVTLRPERVRIESDGPLRLTVAEAVFLGSSVRLRLVAGDLALEALVPVEAAPAAGASVGVQVPAEMLWRFPGAGDQRVRTASTTR
jgi:thiamine transport system ATP-binding protein